MSITDCDRPVYWNLYLAQWWEHSPLTNVARVQIPASIPYVGWVYCWFSALLREVFRRVLRFSPSKKNPTFPNSSYISNGSQEIFNIFFANGRITFIKFEGCFLKGQIRPNGFKIPKCCIVKCLNFTVPFEKKNWESFLFRKRFDWTIFFQEAWFQCPYCKSLFMVI